MPPIVITIAGIKGGTGKTMMAVMLATAAECMGVRAAILDLDTIQSAGKWSEPRPDQQRPPVVFVESVATIPDSGLDKAGAVAALLVEIDKAGRDGAQVVIIDTPARAQAIAEAAIAVAALVLIPSRPLGSEIMSLLETVQLVANERKPGSIVFTAVPFRAPELAEGRATVDQLNLPLAPMFLSDFRPYFRAFAAGKGVTEFEPDGSAAAEVRALWGWIVHHVELSVSHPDEQMNEAPQAVAC